MHTSFCNHKTFQYAFINLLDCKNEEIVRFYGHAQICLSLLLRAFDAHIHATNISINFSKSMDYVRHGEIQGRTLVFFKAHCPCILPCLTYSRVASTNAGYYLLAKGLYTQGSKIPFISSLKQPVFASKQDLFELATLQQSIAQKLLHYRTCMCTNQVWPFNFALGTTIRMSKLLVKILDFRTQILGLENLTATQKPIRIHCVNAQNSLIRSARAVCCEIWLRPDSDKFHHHFYSKNFCF